MDDKNYDDFFDSEEYMKFMEILQNGNIDELGGLIDDTSVLTSSTDSKPDSHDNIKSPNQTDLISQDNSNSLISTSVDNSIENEKKYVLDNISEDVFKLMECRNKKGKCGECGHKLKLVNYTCKCKIIFCGKHRLSEHHKCNFDHKLRSKEILKKHNPQVVNKKINQI